MNTAPDPPATEPATPPVGASQPSASPPPDGLPLHLLAEPLQRQIAWIQQRHGLNAAAACLAVLTPVLCACGGSHQIINPLDARSLPPALSVVLYGCPTTYIQAAIEMGLDPVRRWMLKRIGLPDKTQLRRAQLRLGELSQQQIAKECQINGAAPGLPPSENTLGGAMRGKELAAHQQILKEEHAKIVRETQTVTFLLRPHLLADDAALTRLLRPGDLSTDGAVLHLSTSGHVVPAWTSTNDTTKAELARLLSLAWQGLPDAGANDCHARPLLSNVLVTDPAGVNTLWSDQGLRTRGVTDQLFYLEACQSEAKLDLAAPCPPNAAPLLAKRLQALLDIRLAGQTIEHQLDEPSTDVFASFARKLFDEAQTSQPVQARRLERAPILALKLAVLVHIVSLEEQGCTIEMNTIEFACALAVALSSADLWFVQQRQREAARTIPCPQSQKLEALVTKLKLRGPLCWRDLLRSQRVQKAEPLLLLLDQAIAAGRIRQEGDRYHAVSSPQS